MPTTVWSRTLLAIGLALTLVLGACGSGTDTLETTATEVVVETTAAPTTAAPTTLAPLPEFDVVEASATFLGGIPEGWLSAGDVAKFKEAKDAGGAYIIDVREPSEYAEGHIPGAVNIPIRDLTSNLGAIPLDQPVIVYCASGYRAAMSAAALHMLGYTNARAFGASYKGWTAAEEPTSTDVVELGTFVEPIITDELLAAVDGFVATIPEGWLNLGTVEKMQEAMEAGAYVIDVRETGEYGEGHIPGAVNLPLRTLLDDPSAIPTDQQVIVYCQSGYRAALANATLHIAGFENVRAFSPSWAGWTEAGLEVEA